MNTQKDAKKGGNVSAAPQSSPLPDRLDDVGGGPRLVHVDGHWGPKEAPIVRALFSVPKAHGKIVETIVRRYNQGPAFDAMVEALRGLLEKHRTECNLRLRDNLPDWGDAVENAYAALKLAQETK